VKTFRVWVQPTEYGYFLLVDGVENARWLLDQLGRSFVFRSAEPIAQKLDSSLCTFEVPGGPFVTLNMLRKLLVAIPEVTLLSVAASGGARPER
jgi:hypothetical protein